MTAPTYTRAEIMAMDDTALRLAVAEMMGYEWRESTVHAPALYDKSTGFIFAVKTRSGDIRISSRLPDYPGDIGAAWPVHRLMVESPVTVHHRYMDGLKEALMHRTNQRGMVWTMVLDLLEPADICRAALIAVSEAAQ